MVDGGRQDLINDRVRVAVDMEQVCVVVGVKDETDLCEIS